MITEEEYLKAKAIVDQYNSEKQEDFDLEEDDFNDHDDDESDREQEEYETALNCTCGAWQVHKNRVYHIADCICGAE